MKAFFDKDYSLVLRYDENLTLNSFQVTSNQTYKLNRVRLTNRKILEINQIVS